MKSFEIIQSDRFDREDRAAMFEAAPRLRGAAGQIEDATPAGADLFADLWSSLIRHDPRKKDDVPASHRVNETILDRILAADQYHDVHQYTVGDAVNTASGVCSLTTTAVELLEGMGDVVEQANKAQAARDALEDAMSGEGGTEGEGDGRAGEADDDIESLRSRAEAEAGLLDEMLDEKLPRIDSAIRSSLDEVAQQAEGEAAAAAGWDLSPGDLGRMDPAARIKLMQRLDNDRMKRIAELVGAMTNLAFGQRERRFELRPGEIHGVTLGGSIARLIPAEVASLALPELEDLLLLRLVQRRARNYLTRSVERVGRGAIIYAEDQSGSMTGPKGRWSKAFGLALARIAKNEGRAFHAITFSGAGTWQRFDFPAHTTNVDLMLDYACTEPSGGTEVTGPLDEAIALLEAEFVTNGHLEGDIVLGTDGEVRVPEEWLAEFRATRERLQVNVYGLGIAARIATLNQLCTHVADVTDLTSGRDVAHVFEAVA